jgi:hypothetical protein
MRTAASRPTNVWNSSGDSVLGVVVTETLYLTHEDLSEGQLAKLRAAVVNARALAEVAVRIGLGRHIKLAGAKRRRAVARRRPSSPTPSRPSSERFTSPAASRRRGRSYTCSSTR